MDREKIGQEFYIEDHAVLYGLLLKHADEVCGEKGRKASDNATMLYGRERGLRMAMRCIADGRELTPNHYMAYGEWVDSKKWSESEVVSLSPVFKNNVLKCGWNDSWKKHDLSKYGAVYCTWVDKNLVYGFNPENSLEIDIFLSHGNPMCEFNWVGSSFADAEAFTGNNRLKAEMAARTVKDFLYHTAHILSALKRTFLYELGLLKTNEIVAKALNEYKGKFGEEKTNALVAEAKQDFLVI